MSVSSMSRKDTTKIRKIVTEKLISLFKWLPLMAIGWFSKWFGLINLRSRGSNFCESAVVTDRETIHHKFHQNYYGACSLQQNKDP